MITLKHINNLLEIHNLCLQFANQKKSREMRQSNNKWGNKHVHFPGFMVIACTWAVAIICVIAVITFLRSLTWFHQRERRKVAWMSHTFWHLYNSYNMYCVTQRYCEHFVPILYLFWRFWKVSWLIQEGK